MCVRSVYVCVQGKWKKGLPNPHSFSGLHLIRAGGLSVGVRLVTPTYTHTLTPHQGKATGDYGAGSDDELGSWHIGDDSDDDDGDDDENVDNIINGRDIERSIMRFLGAVCGLKKRDCITISYLSLSLSLHHHHHLRCCWR